MKRRLKGLLALCLVISILLPYQITNAAHSDVFMAKKSGTTGLNYDFAKISKSGFSQWLKTTIILLPNAETVTISNAPKNNMMDVEDTFRFHSTIKTVSGITTKNMIEWVSSDPTVLSIDENGRATALQPGKASILCRTYQSTATQYKHYIAESDPLEIIIKNKSDSVRLISLNSVSVTLKYPDDMMLDNMKATDFVITNVRDTKRNYVKEVQYDLKNKEIILTSYDNFLDGSTYKISHKLFDEKTFYVKIGKPTSIEFNSTEGKVGINNELDIKILDQNGLDITTKQLFDSIYIQEDINAVLAIYNPSIPKWYLKSNKAGITIPLTVISQMPGNKIEIKAEYKIAEDPTWVEPTPTPDPVYIPRNNPTPDPEITVRPQGNPGDGFTSDISDDSVVVTFESISGANEMYDSMIDENGFKATEAAKDNLKPILQAVYQVYKDNTVYTGDYTITNVVGQPVNEGSFEIFDALVTIRLDDLPTNLTKTIPLILKIQKWLE